MRENKETSTANILRILFAVIMVFTLFAFVNSLLVSCIVFNPQYWKIAVFNDEVTGLLMDDADFNSMFTSIDGEARDVLVKESVSMMIESFDDKDADFDDEWLDDYYDEYLTEKYANDEEHSREDFAQMMHESLAHYKEEANGQGLLDGFRKVRTAVAEIMRISLAVTAVLMAVLLYIHRNKFVPVNSFGVSFLFAGIFSLGLWGLVKAVAGELNTSPEEGQWAEVLIDNINSSVVLIIGLCLAVIVLGIVICILAKKAVLLNDENIEELDDEDGYRSFGRRGTDYE